MRACVVIRTAAKLQELKGLLKLLETLTLQLNDSKQSYKEELEALNGQVKLRRRWSGSASTTI